MVAKKKTTKRKTATKKPSRASSAKKAAPKTTKKAASKTARKAATSSKKAASQKHYYFFGKGKADGSGEMKDLLGGKGAGLAEMTNAGVPVPPGFTITTEVCRLFYENNMEIPKAIDKDLEEYVGKVERATGTKFGDPANPLLVSVRSGAKFSMPGMMDTVLNLGLNEDTLKGIAEKTDNMRFALDNYRRFISMFGNVVLGIDKDLFEGVITKHKKDRRIKQDSSLQENDLKDIVKK